MTLTDNINSKGEIKETAFAFVFFYSIAFHIFVIVGIPLITKMLWKPKAFIRPKTFQLISIPTAMVNQQIEVKPITKKKQKHTTRQPVPKTPNTQKSFKPENLNDLEDLLGGMLEPVSNIDFAKAFPYSWYERNIMNKVERFWKPPIKDSNVSVLVSFSIFSNGNISAISVKKSSGNNILDNLAIRAVTLAAPFGKLPPGYTGGKLHIDYTLKPTVK